MDASRREPAKIKVIVPVPVPPEALAAYASQVPEEAVGRGFDVEFVSVRNGGVHGGNLYEALLYEAFVLDAGARAEEHGYAAVCVNSMSDSGVGALRSRLRIPVVGTGQASLLTACMLGHRFSIVTMWRNWDHFYRKILAEQGLGGRLASIRSIDVVPDPQRLLDYDHQSTIFEALAEQADRAVKEDGADVIVIGSTTMHQAHSHLASRLPVPVVNPGLVAYKMCELLLSTGLTHSKAAYPAPAHTSDDIFSTVPSRYASS